MHFAMDVLFYMVTSIASAVSPPRKHHVRALDSVNLQSDRGVVGGLIYSTNKPSACRC